MIQNHLRSREKTVNMGYFPWYAGYSIAALTCSTVTRIVTVLALSPNLSLIENIWSWVAEGLAHHLLQLIRRAGLTIKHIKHVLRASQDWRALKNFTICRNFYKITNKYLICCFLFFQAFSSIFYSFVVIFFDSLVWKLLPYIKDLVDQGEERERIMCLEWRMALIAWSLPIGQVGRVRGFFYVIKFLLWYSRALNESLVTSG